MLAAKPVLKVKVKVPLEKKILSKTPDILRKETKPFKNIEIETKFEKNGDISLNLTCQGLRIAS